MKATIETFYKAFADLDADKMISCYHEDIVFNDPAFGELHGLQAKNMWRMLCDNQRGKGFQLTYSDIIIDGDHGEARWEARYVFSKTGRKVHNNIRASFQFQDGLILAHTDTFDLHSWAKQALGFKGLLLGGTRFFQKQLQKQTNGMLDRFTAKQLHND